MVRVMRATGRELTSEKAAGVAGVTPWTVRWWVSKGLVKGRILPAGGRMGGRACRVDASSLREWVKGGREKWKRDQRKKRNKGKAE
jgi:hypothetical protein